MFPQTMAGGIGDAARPLSVSIYPWMSRHSSRRGKTMRRTKAFAVVLAGVFVASTAVAQTSNPGPGSSPGTQVPGTTQSAQPGTPGVRPVPSTSQPSCTPGIGNQPCLPSPTGSSASGGSMTTGPSGLPQVPPPTAPGSGASSQPPLQPCPPGTMSQSAAPCLPGGGTPLPPGASPPSPTATMPK